MAPKPTLQPLKTPKTMSYPSELYYSPRSSTSDTTEKAPSSTASLSPPPSYTDFLKALTPVFSPSSAGGASFPRCPSNNPHPSPVSIPSSTTSTSFSESEKASSSKKRRGVSASVPPPSPASAPVSARPSGPGGRLRLPPPYTICSPGMGTPRSASFARSPYSPPEWRVRYVESPRSANTTSLSVQHVVTTTVTFKRSPPLGPPPKGKRRRSRDSEEHWSCSSISNVSPLTTQRFFILFLDRFLHYCDFSFLSTYCIVQV